MSPAKPTSRKCVGPCGRTLALNADNFRKDSAQRNGYKPRCKTCEPKRGQKVATVGIKPFGKALNEPAAYPPRIAWPNVDAFDRDVDHPEAIDLGVVRDPDLLRYIKATEILDKKPAEKATEEKVSAVEEHRLKKRLKSLEAENRQLIKDLSNAQILGDIAREASENPVQGIEPRERKSGLREAVAVCLASDWHIEERVLPGQVNGKNEYNLEISERRMTRYFEAVRWSLDFNRQSFLIRDLVLWLGGDLISGYLHMDQIESNYLSPAEAIAYAHASIVAGIRHLLKDPKLERIVVPCNDGNHGRMTDKMRAATRVESSLEILLYRMLEREFATEPRVEFMIAEGPFLYYDVYGKTIRFTHGDTCKYGGGVGGVTIPIYKSMARWDTVRPANLSCMGHFHQLTSLNDLVINGSLIGYSAYSMQIGARFEEPAQAFFLLDSKRFKTVSMPLWVDERDPES